MMASFKHKPSKIKYRQDYKTLDDIHKDIVTKFDIQSKELPKIKKELRSLEDELKNTNKNNNKKRQELKNKISVLKKKIDNTTNRYDELEYFDKTYDILTTYYNFEVETGNQSEFIEVNSESDEDVVNKEPEPISEIDQRLIKLNEMSNKNMKIKKPVKKRIYNTEDIPKKSILSFLTCDDVQDQYETVTQSKASLKEQYMTLMDPLYNSNKKNSGLKYCSSCKNSDNNPLEKVFVANDGLYACPKCGESEHIILDCDGGTHKDNNAEKPKYPYKKINHLIEKLNQYQSKETTDIPESVYKIIDHELRKQVISMDDVTPKSIKEILRKHRLNAFYEHSQYIFSKVTKTPAPILTREIEEKIKKMFKEVQTPFLLYKPPDRANFLNYAYVLHKFFLILKMPNHAKYFPLLKSKEKLRNQDVVWKKICKYNGWEYHPSP